MRSGFGSITPKDTKWRCPMKLTCRLVQVSSTTFMKYSNILKYPLAQFRNNGMRFLLLFFIAFAVALVGFNRGESSAAANLVFHPPTIDLSLSKSVSARPLGGYRPGQQITYQLVVQNDDRCRKADGVI